MGHCKQVEHGVRGAAHCNVERHRIEEGGTGGYAAREHGFIIPAVVFLTVVVNGAGGLFEQFLTEFVGCEGGSVARKRETYRLGETVHRIGGKHTRAAAATGTGGGLYGGDFSIAHRRVGGLHHCIDEVQPGLPQHSGLHWTAGHEDCRYVQTHRGNEHTGSNLVAVADAHQGIRLVGVHHILHAVGDYVPGRQGIEHSVVAHRYAVIHGNGVELGSKAAELLQLTLHRLSGFVKMGMSGDKLGEGICNGDYRFAHLLILHSVGLPQRSRSGHSAAFKCYTTTQFHTRLLNKKFTNFVVKIDKSK